MSQYDILEDELLHYKQRRIGADPEDIKYLEEKIEEIEEAIQKSREE